MAICPTCGRDYDPHALSPRECEVIALVADGLANKQIARVLGISAWTVKNHMVTLKHKLAVSNRTEAVVACLRLGIIQLGG